MSTLVLSNSGTVRGRKGGVFKVLAELREQSERLEQSPVLQKLREEESPQSPGQRGKVVVYITSMKGVRETYEKCQRAIQILRGHQILFTAKDVFLHPDYGSELKLRLGDTQPLTVPQLYIEGDHIGDSDTIQELNERGQLTAMLRGFETRSPSHVCLLCQGNGFVICLWCKGSKKGMKTSFGDLRCTVCNQNALQRCPECSL